MADVFVSYSRDDRKTAQQFATGLEREGFGVWWDQAIHAGEAFDRAIEQALVESQAVVVLWSRRSVESDWVRAEATQARATRRLVPVTIEPCKRPVIFEPIHTADLTGWSGDVTDPRWRTFVDDLRRTIGQARQDPGLAQQGPVAAPASRNGRAPQGCPRDRGRAACGRGPVLGPASPQREPRTHGCNNLHTGRRPWRKPA